VAKRKNEGKYKRRGKEKENDKIRIIKRF
jgi:hypothetical protein